MLMNLACRSSACYLPASVRCQQLMRDAISKPGSGWSSVIPGFQVQPFPCRPNTIASLFGGTGLVCRVIRSSGPVAVGSESSGNGAVECSGSPGLTHYANVWGTFSGCLPSSGTFQLTPRHFKKESPGACSAYAWFASCTNGLFMF